MHWDICAMKIIARRCWISFLHLCFPVVSLTHAGRRFGEAIRKAMGCRGLWAAASFVLLIFLAEGCRLQDRMFTAKQPEQKDTASSSRRFLHPNRGETFFLSEWPLTLFWIIVHRCGLIEDDLGNSLRVVQCTFSLFAVILLRKWQYLPVYVLTSSAFSFSHKQFPEYNFLS